MAERCELKVAGMNCMHCAGAVTRAVEAVSGTDNVMVSLEGASVTFEVADDGVVERVRRAITAAGYSVTSV
ncbi:heavy-metal-associated domain-containing protein [Desulfoluna spongiiphila]|uniref:Copper chaperone n=1 Tax=Desulfoluna spongiiphila TaxID=419481 RepID=A0A1G5ATW1_9BACT|nr:heavy-metal-associated domain-containing protein [Desulfoluna spongiiphila]SCX81332.1 copper chaperone [Desulfoluna spongiiphila]VVS92008.1 heavy metal-associated domain hma [Desulfoluna spongiiphila]